MKINLLIGKPSINGYLNIDQLFNGEKDKVQGDLTNLDSVVDHNECSEILAIDVLDFIPLGIRQQCLHGWLTKLSHGGTITLSCLDLAEFTRKVYNGELSDTFHINKLLFGEVTNTWNIRKSICTLSDTVNMVMMTGQFEIVSQKFDGVYYIVTAKRR